MYILFIQHPNFKFSYILLKKVRHIFIIITNHKSHCTIQIIKCSKVDCRDSRLTKLTNSITAHVLHDCSLHYHTELANSITAHVLHDCSLHYHTELANSITAHVLHDCSLHYHTELAAVLD